MLDEPRCSEGEPDFAERHVFLPEPLIMPARDYLPTICQSVKVAKVVQVHSIWIGTLKNLFMVGTFIYIW